MSDGLLRNYLRNSALFPIQRSRLYGHKSKEIDFRRRVRLMFLLLPIPILCVFVFSAITQVEEHEGIFLRRKCSPCFPSQRPNGMLPSQYTTELLTVKEQDDSKVNIPSSSRSVSVSGKNKSWRSPHLVGSTLPPGHPCQHFSLTPPPADKKRTGPRPCPVCYLPVEKAMVFIISCTKEFNLCSGEKSTCN